MIHEIKSRLEIIPLLLVLESFICFLLSYFNFYKSIFAYWEDLTECSLLMCIILYGISGKWGFVAKKSIATLFLLNIVNIFYSVLDTDKYYNIIFGVLFSCFLILIIYDLCRKK